MFYIYFELDGWYESTGNSEYLEVGGDVCFALLIINYWIGHNEVNYCLNYDPL